MSSTAVASLAPAEAVAQVASDQVARSLRVTRGAMVQGVPPGSAADKAGLLGTRRTLTGIAAGMGCAGQGIARCATLPQLLCSACRQTCSSYL